MKKYLLALLFLAVAAAAHADDAADLQRLQPLNAREQTMYDGVKDDPSKLHDFIVTRRFFHTVDQVVKANHMDEGSGDKWSAADMKNFPPVTKEVQFAYTLDLGEQLRLYDIMVAQGLYVPK